ncbi:glucosaminidase domain-containing protein [Enterococcus sp. UD-01]|jgi:flagellum-specific peptidoglycan hydrolase FlgJ|uniref:glucosaminidase domain-containing protein n=1 Tax=Enterococcus sp. UD-01 TaxID=3373911 RepID=UPI003834CE96
MKRKILSLQLICALTAVYFTPVLSYADQLLPDQTEQTIEEPAGTSDSSSTDESSTTTTTTTTTESEDSSTSTTSSSSTEPTETTESSSSDIPQDSSTAQTVEPPATSEQPPITDDQKQEQTPAPAPSVEAEKPSVDLGTESAQDQSDQEIVITKNESTESFIKKIGEKARKVGQKYDLYASVMIAQAILESGSGGSQLSRQPYHNLFGIKGTYKGQAVVFNTKEDNGSGQMFQIQAAFKQYPGYKESFEDYAKLMKNGVLGNPRIYAGTWKKNAATYKDATKALTGVYATDTSYNKKLNAFIKKYNLTEYDKAKPSKTSAGKIIVADSHPDSDFPEYSGETYSGSELYAAGNCTQYVYNRIVQLDGKIGTTMGNGMDWGTTGKANGYKVSNKPKAGTAVSFQPNEAGADSTYGHVAFVEHVYKDGSILISEMNAVGLGVVSFRIIDQSTANALSYITPK